MKAKPLNQAASKPLLLAFLLFSFTSGCSVKLVQPYDEKLVTDTEAFYKKAARIIEHGRAVSPKTNEERKAISEPSKHPGNFSQFEPKYNDLLIDTEALIMRAMAGSNEIDRTGQKLQAKLEDLIETNIPSVCEGLAEEFGKTSLTVKNYIDLKCIVSKWKVQHADPRLTRNTMILKKANWEGRKKSIFDAVLAIQKAEAFKRKGHQK